MIPCAVPPYRLALKSAIVCTALGPVELTVLNRRARRAPYSCPCSVNTWFDTDTVRDKHTHAHTHTHTEREREREREIEREREEQARDSRQ